MSRSVIIKFAHVLVLVAGGFAAVVATWWLWPAHTPVIRGGVAPIALLEQVSIGGVPQWLLIRGQDRNAPVLVFLHGGPGMPSMYLAHSFQWELEKSFVVVQWDRRGAGKSYRADLGPTLTSEQLVLDTIDLLEYLRERFRQPKIILVGHSWGSYLGMLVVQRRPDLVRAYVGVGQLAAMGEPIRRIQLEFLMREAQRRGDRDALEHLAKHPDDREGLLFRYGAEIRGMQSFYPLLWKGLTSPEYSARDVRRLVQGLNLYSSNFRDNSIQGELSDNVTDVQVPVYFATGRHDYTDPFELTEMYFQRLAAPKKQLVWFENSAHFPFYEEPQAFGRLMQQVAEESK